MKAKKVYIVTKAVLDHLHNIETEIQNIQDEFNPERLVLLAESIIKIIEATEQAVLYCEGTIKALEPILEEG